MPVQVPALHSVPAAQRWPQLPQLAVALWVSTHAVPQRVSPAPHEQTLPAQLAPAAQGLLQAQQLFASVARSTQAPSQSVVGSPATVAQELAQAPREQTVPDGHARPHPPQLSGSLWVEVQTPLQRVPPFAHWHVPPWQVVPPAHRVPQAPQAAPLRDASAPLRDAGHFAVSASARRRISLALSVSWLLTAIANPSPVEVTRAEAPLTASGQPF